MPDTPRLSPVVLILVVLVAFGLFCGVFLVAPVALMIVGYLAITASDRARRRRPEAVATSRVATPQLPRAPLSPSVRTPEPPTS